MAQPSRNLCERALDKLGPVPRRELTVEEQLDAMTIRKKGGKPRDAEVTDSEARSRERA